jgi:uncharacterized membrane protein
MPEQQPPADFKETIKKEIDKIPPTNDRNLMAALSYVWILSIVMLIVRRGDTFIQFHAKQGVILLILSIFGFIPVIGWIVWILAVVGMIFGFINAWQGREYRLPIVYEWSTKIRL